MALRHGTRTGYSYYQCKCDRCRAAHAQYNREYKEGVRRWTATAPATAHITALRAEGWTLAGLARHTGYHVQTIRNLALGKTRHTNVTTVEDILSIPIGEAAA